MRAVSYGLMVVWATSTSQAGAECANCEACRRVEGHCRAGYSQCIAPWAMPSTSPHEAGYYVGRGLFCHGETRHRDEGTWGWDYRGALFEKRIWPGWSHGKYVGAYRTDGHKLLGHE